MNFPPSDITLFPAFTEKNVPVFCSTDDKFAPYCGVMLQSIIDHASPAWNYDLIVLQSGLSEESRQLLTSLAKGKDHISIRLYDVSMLLQGKNFYHNDVYTLATWYRLFAPSIFTAYDKIVYLDADVVVLTDVAELFSEEIGESWLGGCNDLGVAADAVRNNSTPYYLDTIGVSDMAKYINAGVLVFNIRLMRAFDVEQTCIHSAQTHQFRHNDQDTLNHVCRGHIHFLDLAWNTFPDHDFEKYIEPEQAKLWVQRKAAPRIIHYIVEKPWDNPFSDMASYWWQAAAHTPFYDKIQRTLLHTLIRRVMRYKRDVRKYWGVRLLSKLTFGKLRRRLIERKHTLRRELRLTHRITKGV